MREMLHSKDGGDILLPEELGHFLEELEKITRTTESDSFLFWDQTHTAKEHYRAITKMGISGKEMALSIPRAKEIVELFLKKLEEGLAKAQDPKTGIVSTYFEYVPVDYTVLREDGQEKKNRYGQSYIHVQSFKREALPLFLEGPMHALRVSQDPQEAKKMHEQILKSELYDKKLKMLKLNASLDKAKLHIGRIKVFTPGWLENESIFMHMEYKYLLELLRHGLVEEFFKLAPSALVPFLNPARYGRSIFENSSFIVSSAHPESQIHGQGFVSRLTGTTAELISIWIVLTSGSKPYQLDAQGQLNLKWTPQLPGSFFTRRASQVPRVTRDGREEWVQIPKNAFAFLFAGETLVIYHNPSRKNTFGHAKAEIKNMTLTYFDGRQEPIEGDLIGAPYVGDVRNGKVKQIDITLS
jgi:hypothetical protein